MSKYIEMYKAYLDIQRTKSSNLAVHSHSTVVAAVTPGRAGDEREADGVLKGSRARIDSEEDRQIKTLLTSVLDAMISDRVNGSIHRTEVVFGSVFEQYHYLFNGTASEPVYRFVIGEVMKKVRENKMTVEKDLCVPVVVNFKNSGKPDERYWVYNIDMAGTDIILYVKDKDWNETFIRIYETGDTALWNWYKKAKSEIDHIFITESGDRGLDTVKAYAKYAVQADIVFTSRNVSVGED